MKYDALEKKLSFFISFLSLGMKIFPPLLLLSSNSGHPIGFMRVAPASRAAKPLKSVYSFS